MRLHICGEIVGEQVLTSLKSNVTASDCTRKISLFSVGGDGYSVQGFIHCAEASPSSVPVNYHYTKVSVFKSSSPSSFSKRDSCPVFL